jgi:hypothetical protein
VGKPNVLLLDIETSPILAQVWDIWNQNVGLNQIQQDWHLLSFSAKWLESHVVIYEDQRGAKDITDDSKLCKSLHSLLSVADIIVTHNGKKFDQRKINSRMAFHGLKPLPAVRHFDTCVVARKHFGFTSNKLEYLCKHLGLKQKKEQHKSFPGHELWTECLKGNKAAWNEMERYNRQDVLALQELYQKLLPWEPTYNHTVYSEDGEFQCPCGCRKRVKNGYRFTATGKFQRFLCTSCGKESSSTTNLLNAETKRKVGKG